jgi:fatty-acyl-CoA synthase
VVLEPGALPRTSSGKIRRREALRRHLAGELAPPDPVNALEMTRALGRSVRSFSRARKAERDGSG